MSFLRLYFSCSGRLSCKQFWIASLIPFGIYATALALAGSAPSQMFGAEMARGTNWKYAASTQLIAFFKLPKLMLCISLLASFSMIALQTKRLHDLGRSGWWQWIWLAALPVTAVSLIAFSGRPVAGATVLNLMAYGFVLWGFWIYVQIWFQPGQPEKNRFGPHPELAEISTRLAADVEALAASSGAAVLPQSSAVIKPRAEHTPTGPAKPQGFGRRPRTA